MQLSALTSSAVHSARIPIKAHTRSSAITNESVSDGIRFALRWAATENLVVNYAYDDSKSKDTSGILTWVPLDIPTSPPFAAVLPSTEFPKAASRAYINDYYVTNAKGHSLTLDWALNDAITLKSITAYRESWT